MARLLGNSAVGKRTRLFSTSFLSSLSAGYFRSTGSHIVVWFSPNSFSYRGSYSKCRGEGSQIFWIRLGGAVGQGVVRGIIRCSIGGAYEWVYGDFLDLFMGGNTFLQRNDATLLFRVCCCFASIHNAKKHSKCNCLHTRYACIPSYIIKSRVNCL